MFIVVKNYIMSIQITDFDLDCAMFCERINVDTVNEESIPSPYNHLTANIDEILVQFEESIAKVPKKNDLISIAGDMNLSGLDWWSCRVRSDCQSSSQHTFS